MHALSGSEHYGMLPGQYVPGAAVLPLDVPGMPASQRHGHLAAVGYVAPNSMLLPQAAAVMAAQTGAPGMLARPMGLTPLLL